MTGDCPDVQYTVLQHICIQQGLLILLRCYDDEHEHLQSILVL